MFNCEVSKEVENGQFSANTKFEIKWIKLYYFVIWHPVGLQIPQKPEDRI